MIPPKGSLIISFRFALNNNNKIATCVLFTPFILTRNPTSACNLSITSLDTFSKSSLFFRFLNFLLSNFFISSLSFPLTFNLPSMVFVEPCRYLLFVSKFSPYFKWILTISLLHFFQSSLKLNNLSLNNLIFIIW